MTGLSATSTNLSPNSSCQPIHVRGRGSATASVARGSVELSNELRVLCFMTADGQLSWAVIAHRPAKGCLSVKRGKLHVEANGS